MCARCLDDVYEIPQWCIQGVSIMSRRCLNDVHGVSQWWVRGVSMMCTRCLRTDHFTSRPRYETFTTHKDSGDVTEMSCAERAAGVRADEINTFLLQTLNIRSARSRSWHQTTTAKRLTFSNIHGVHNVPWSRLSMNTNNVHGLDVPRIIARFRKFQPPHCCYLKSLRRKIWRSITVVCWNVSETALPC